MSPFYYKYIDPVIDYLQPFPKIISDPVVITTVLGFGLFTVIWLYLFINKCKE